VNIWLYEIPMWVLGLLVLGTFVVVSVLGLLLTRPLIRWLGPPENDFANYFVAGVGVFYALLIGLIAVAVWERFSSVEEVVSGEGVTIAQMYRDLEGYPSPEREVLQAKLRNYVVNVIEAEWPVQQRGLKPKTTHLANDLAMYWVRFEPKTAGQTVIHAECMRQLNVFLGYRRARIGSIEGALPPVMWFVVLAGGALAISLTYFFRTQNRRLHMALTAALSCMIGLVIFLIIALDRPLVGTVSVQPDGFHDLLTRIMKVEAPSGPKPPSPVL
jgi:Protein of unknown function (DUF4239)